MLWDDVVAAGLAEAFEDVGEAGVFEILCDDDEWVVAEAFDEADEFEVAVVWGDPDGVAVLCDGLFFGVVGVAVEEVVDVVFGEFEGPEEVEEGACEGAV